MSKGARQLAQLASVAICAVALLGAVVLTASRGLTSEVLYVPALASTHTLDKAQPPQLREPTRRRKAAHEKATAGPATVAPTVDLEVFTLSGWVIGDAPGHGQAWAIEAYRLTQDRTAVIESRRWYVEPDGRLRLTGLGAGLWQTVLVSPRFAWGPLVDTSTPPAELRLGADATGQICVHMVADGAAPLGVPLRLLLTAARGPELEGARVSVHRRLAARDVLLGETVMLNNVSEGTYQVTATLARDEPEWGLRPRSRQVSVTVRPGTTHVELAFVDQPGAGGACPGGKATAPR